MTKIKKLLDFVEGSFDNKQMKVVKIPSLGAAFWVESNGHLYTAPLKTDNTVDWEVAGEVTAPESQDALDIINDELYTHFKMSQFAGR